MNLSPEEETFVGSHLVEERKSLLLAYLLWAFMGVFGAHRLYLGRPRSAVLQFLSMFVVVGFAWWVADAFLIPSMLEDERRRRRAEALEETRARSFIAENVHRSCGRHPDGAAADCADCAAMRAWRGRAFGRRGTAPR